MSATAVEIALLGIGVLLSVLGVLCVGWALSKSGAAAAWQTAAGGYKEQVQQLSGRLSRAESQAVTLNAEVVRLESLPDYGDVLALLAELRALGGDIKETVDEIAARWG